MAATERRWVGTLLAMVALFAPGFLLHEAPRFPGSLAGGILGTLGAFAMLLLLAYSLARRADWLKKRVSLGALLTFHVYAGAIGAAFGILHTGHKYQSLLGIALVSSMLAVVLSGFVGRYLLARIGTDIGEQRRELGSLRARYDAVASSAGRTAPSDVPVPALIAGIADLEDVIGRREALKRALTRWIVLHVAAALVMYPLLVLHVWTGVYYGLRWLR